MSVKQRTEQVLLDWKQRKAKREGKVIKLGVQTVPVSTSLLKVNKCLTSMSFKPLSKSWPTDPGPSSSNRLTNSSIIFINSSVSSTVTFANLALVDYSMKDLLRAFM